MRSINVHRPRGGRRVVELKEFGSGSMDSARHPALDDSGDLPRPVDAKGLGGLRARVTIPAARHIGPRESELLQQLAGRGGQQTAVGGNEGNEFALARRKRTPRR